MAPGGQFDKLDMIQPRRPADDQRVVSKAGSERQQQQRRASILVLRLFVCKLDYRAIKLGFLDLFGSHGQTLSIQVV